MSTFQIFTFSVFDALSDYSALCAPTLTQAHEDLCLKEGRTYAEDSVKGLGEMEEQHSLTQKAEDKFRYTVSEN